MAQRKEKMLELGDLFLAFPGGIGTLEEISEIMSLNKLDMVSKPFAFLDYEGYWQPMKALLDRMAGEGFVWKEWVERILFIRDLEELERYCNGMKQ